MRLEHRWRDSDRREQNYSKIGLSQYHFIHHRFHMKCPEMWGAKKVAGGIDRRLEKSA
jgi:hypothetical protein